MRRFIVATHAYMSKGIVSSLELIMGPQENLKYFCAYVEENKPYQIELLKELDSYDPEDEIVIFTDLFGGSVNNEITKLIHERKNIHLISGTNLILLMSMVLSDLESPIEDVIRFNIEQAKEGIVYCNDALNEDAEVELDEF